MNDDKFPLGRENYCAQCYIETDQAILKTECPHAENVAEEPEQKKITAADVLADERELFMNSPEGYAFAERINQRDEGRLKSFLINVFGAMDDAWSDAIRAASLEQVVQTFLDNNFTFDPEWYGVRELPKGIDGRPKSRLDDPDYQRRMGFSQ